MVLRTRQEILVVATLVLVALAVAQPAESPQRQMVVQVAVAHRAQAVINQAVSALMVR